MASAALDLDHSLGNGGAAQDSTGCLAGIGHFLEPLGPCLVLLADGDGEVIAADSLGSGLGAGAAAGLAQPCDPAPRPQRLPGRESSRSWGPG